MWGKKWKWFHIFFCFNILIFIYFFKYETISTFAPTFWTLIISELGGVPLLQISNSQWFYMISNKTKPYKRVILFHNKLIVEFEAKKKTNRK
jgi:hypothetical protein